MATPFALSVALSATFIALALPVLGTLPHNFDEGWLILDARFILQGQRPYVDFPHHEMPLHLYLLALFGKVFGQTLFGFRILSLSSIALSGFLLFSLLRPVVGPIPGLVAQALFLFLPAQQGALPAIPESPMVALTLLGALLLFAARTRWTAYASGVVFVAALMTKPTCLPMVLGATASLAYARQWRRLLDLAASGVVATAVALAWVVHISDGVFADTLAFELGRIGTRHVGMWSIDSGFSELRRLGGIETPWQLAMSTFKEFFLLRHEYLSIWLFFLSLLAIPVWVSRCARAHPAVRAFAVLWPASFLFVNFIALDFVSPRYFVPFLAFSAFLLGGWIWFAQQIVPVRAVAVAGAIAAVVLARDFRTVLVRDSDPWYWGRIAEITREAPGVVSFSSMLFAATGAEPACGFANAALTYGAFGDAWLLTARTRDFRFTDARLIECLRAHPQTRVVIDWAFYFFTRPGSPLRQYLAGDGKEQRLFLSPEAVRQWDLPSLQMSPLR